jgi:transposase
MRTRPCTCCSRIFDGRVPGPAIVAWWGGPNGLIAYLCQQCLDIWFDAGDEDDDLEPDAVYWLDGSRRLVKEVAAHAQ